MQAASGCISLHACVGTAAAPSALGAAGGVRNRDAGMRRGADAAPAPQLRKPTTRPGIASPPEALRQLHCTRRSRSASRQHAQASS
ncbi:hypothetical protein FA09DRAFT_331161 [Tilletiopsis washingtonensis]|uniref:Uncharacterized protein n=1 Tax=Tilletiopsis washingtonensis TaxID=58919 RepID=A0A316Z5X3_9BASI|nr:hypothetical protein FA09DRAFT_331161 [Tilletiopsis washingtonensis]PWN96686.1 hypothetical protein FA09DRAFT_331161 [Tilletiopsis washingtonensis]